MQALLLLSLICVFGFLSAHAGADEQKCGPFEQLDTCPKCDFHFDCPLNNMPEKLCKTNGSCLPQKCICIFNYRRAPNGICIPIEKCPPLPCNRPNEEYNPCPPYCPTDDCNQVTATGECPFPGLLLVRYCTPTCRCRNGFWRVNGVCVSYQKCLEHRAKAATIETIKVGK